MPSIAFHEMIEIVPKVIGTTHGIAIIPVVEIVPRVVVVMMGIVERAAAIMITAVMAVIGEANRVGASKIPAPRKYPYPEVAGIGLAEQEVAGRKAAMTMVVESGIGPTTRAVVESGIGPTTRAVVENGIGPTTTRVVAVAISRIRAGTKSAFGGFFQRLN